VSSELYWFLTHDLQIESKRPDDLLLPRFWEWNKGLQAQVLRTFCLGNGLPSIRFHTLRACFSTQLISSGVPPSVVMKICGWKGLKTMQRYIRMAGIDEAGATEVLRFVPTEEAVMEKVVNMYDHRKKD
jgi:integrase